jgi:hypothetical protein
MLLQLCKQRPTAELGAPHRVRCGGCARCGQPRQQALDISYGSSSDGGKQSLHYAGTLKMRSRNVSGLQVMLYGGPLNMCTALQ